MTRRASEGAGGAKTVNLALQGGGSHGACAWGVLDALTEDARIEVSAISGASAGAMNAVVYGAGLAEGGRDGARAKLEKFWLSVSAEGSLAPAQRKLVNAWLRPWGVTPHKVHVRTALASQSGDEHWRVPCASPAWPRPVRSRPDPTTSHRGCARRQP